MKSIVWFHHLYFLNSLTMSIFLFTWAIFSLARHVASFGFIKTNYNLVLCVKKLYNSICFLSIELTVFHITIIWQSRIIHCFLALPTTWFYVWSFIVSHLWAVLSLILFLYPIFNISSYGSCKENWLPLPHCHLTSTRLSSKEHIFEVNLCIKIDKTLLSMETNTFTWKCAYA